MWWCVMTATGTHGHTAAAPCGICSRQPGCSRAAGWLQACCAAARCTDVSDHYSPGVVQRQLSCLSTASQSVKARPMLSYMNAMNLQQRLACALFSRSQCCGQHATGWPSRAAARICCGSPSTQVLPSRRYCQAQMVSGTEELHLTFLLLTSAHAAGGKRLPCGRRVVPWRQRTPGAWRPPALPICGGGDQAAGRGAACLDPPPG